MKLKQIYLERFRNYDRADITFSEGINLILGENGQGKTNFLESIYYLLTSHALRSVKDKELISWQGGPMRLMLSFYRDSSPRENILKFASDGTKKYLALNEVRYEKRSELPFLPMAVSFLPDDLQIIKGSPEKRRHYLDRELAIIMPLYDSYRKTYQRSLYQRNEALKNVLRGQLKRDSLLPWNEQLATYGAKVIAYRLAFLAKLVPISRKIHQFITKNQHDFDISYQSSFGKLSHFDEASLKALFLDFMTRHEEEEIKKGTTLYGPHRDDIGFYQGGIDLRVYGSQGGQRSAILALKLSVVSYIEKYFKEKPILLLDDVMSELDSKRQSRLLQIISKKGIQTLITGTEMDENTYHLLPVRLFEVKEGKITPWQ